MLALTPAFLAAEARAQPIFGPSADSLQRSASASREHRQGRLSFSLGNGLPEPPLLPRDDGYSQSSSTRRRRSSFRHRAIPEERFPLLRRPVIRPRFCAPEKDPPCREKRRRVRPLGRTTGSGAEARAARFAEAQGTAEEQRGETKEPRAAASPFNPSRRPSTIATCNWPRGVRARRVRPRRRSASGSSRPQPREPLGHFLLGEALFAVGSSPTLRKA